MEKWYIFFWFGEKIRLCFRFFFWHIYFPSHNIVSKSLLRQDTSFVDDFCREYLHSFHSTLNNIIWYTLKETKLIFTPLSYTLCRWSVVWTTVLASLFPFITVLVYRDFLAWAMKLYVARTVIVHRHVNYNFMAYYFVIWSLCIHYHMSPRSLLISRMIVLVHGGSSAQTVKLYVARTLWHINWYYIFWRLVFILYFKWLYIANMRRVSQKHCRKKNIRSNAFSFRA